VLVKINAIELLEKELRRKRVKGTIGFGSMSDPYTPAERKYNLTGQALEIIKNYRFPVNLITKSDLVLKDLDTLVQINHVQASICFTITTTDDGLARKLEPGAPLPSARFNAMKTLAHHGIHVGVTLMPVLPFIEDNHENITQIVEQTVEHGGSFIIPWFGMSLRDRQRSYYYEQLDRLFPGMRDKYERRFGPRYSCPADHAKELSRHFDDLCAKHGLSTRIPRYLPPEKGIQPRLW
jgi:DNA repair photolyase